MAARREGQIRPPTTPPPSCRTGLEGSYFLGGREDTMAPRRPTLPAWGARDDSDIAELAVAARRPRAADSRRAPQATACMGAQTE
eukprot:7958942-Pyramimonas_sp.AAC.1